MEASAGLGCAAGQGSALSVSGRAKASQPGSRSFITPRTYKPQAYDVNASKCQLQTIYQLAYHSVELPILLRLRIS